MQFWDMSPKGERNELVLRLADFDEADAMIEVSRGEREPPGGVVRLERHMGARQHDILYASFATPVSARFAETLAGCGATGWSTLPIRVEGRPDLEKKYRLLVVHGRCGPVEFGRGGTRKIPIGDGRDGRFTEKLVGLWFDPATWDGSDVFTTCRGFRPKVTRKVVDAIKQAKLAGIKLVPIEEVLSVDISKLRKE